MNISLEYLRHIQNTLVSEVALALNDSVEYTHVRLRYTAWNAAALITPTFTHPTSSNIVKGMCIHM